MGVADRVGQDALLDLPAKLGERRGLDGRGLGEGGAHGLGHGAPDRAFARVAQPVDHGVEHFVRDLAEAVPIRGIERRAARFRIAHGVSKASAANVEGGRRRVKSERGRSVKWAVSMRNRAEKQTFAAFPRYCFKGLQLTNALDACISPVSPMGCSEKASRRGSVLLLHRFQGFALELFVSQDERQQLGHGVDAVEVALGNARVGEP